MIRHILKKDLRLLWPFAAALAIAPFALIAVDLRRGHFQLGDATLSSLLLLLELAFYFGAAALILTLVHQDSLVGVRQDWLARPIRRRDLLAAKLLFVLAVVQLPMLLANLLEGLADGFPFSHAFLPALSQNVWLLLAFTLPLLAIASLTRSMTTATAFAVGIFAIFMCGIILLKMISGNPLGPTQATAVAWIPGAARLLIYLLASVAILLLQFFRRRTRTSITVLGAALIVSLIVDLTPWSLAFHFQQDLSPSPSSAKAIQISLSTNPEIPAAPNQTTKPSPMKETPLSPAGGNSTLHLPILVRGLPPHSILKIDRAVASVQLPGSRRRILLTAPNISGAFHMPGYAITAAAPDQYNETIHVRSRTYSALKNRRVTLSVTYSATLLHLSSVNRLAPSGANLRIPGIGWCQTRINENHTEVELRCLQIGHPSQCMASWLANPASGRRNPDVHGCRGSYSPWFGRYKPLVTTAFAGTNMLFRDPSGLIHYPVNASQLRNSVVMLRTYQPEAHFTRTLTIPNIKLADFTVQQ